jgi:hypothetical protein
MTTTHHTDLERLGRTLHRATRRDLRRRKLERSRRVAVVALAVCAAFAAVAGATGLFSGDDVAAGMPAGAVMFGGTHPACSDADAGGAFHCTLRSLPTEETLDDYTGSKELINLRGRVAGGCIGQDAQGREWDCYLGEAAVKHEILSHDLLGQPASGPSAG